MSFDLAQGSLDLETLRAAYRTGALTPERLIGAIYRRMERDALPSVFIHRIPEQEALAAARALAASVRPEDAPLYGVPFAVKDNIDVAGMPTSAACPAFSYLPERSAPTVAALLEAGALCIGKVNLDQFATGLVGTRSPYGACENVFDPAIVSGGSSSGSAVAVAAQHVSFTLGTDTAGSGRVPAALNNVVGLKPSLGALDGAGMVPACASLDCISIFALTVGDASEVRRIMQGPAPTAASLPSNFRFGVPAELHPETDAAQRRAFAAAIESLRTLGGRPMSIDFTPFYELGWMLYGPSVAERYLALGAFIERQPGEVLPVTRAIILRGREIDAQAAIAGMQRIARLRGQCHEALAPLDLLVTPTVPRPITREEDAREPQRANDVLGIYTRFANYLGCPVLAVPAGFREDRLPFGLSLIGKPGHDAALDALAARVHAASGAGMGRTRQALPEPSAAAEKEPRERARVAVVGAHMRGLPLNAQLLELGASFVCEARTAARYRLFVLPGSAPERPGLVRVTQGGEAIALELWEMPWSALGELLARVPAPLSIGTLELSDGQRVHGFLCESYASEGAREISQLGGYRAYLAQR